MWSVSLVLSLPLLNAQSNYRPGFIITLQNDTVFGKIDFRTDIMNAKRCVFQSSDNAGAIIYNPFDILGYRFTDDGKYYVSRNIELQYGVPQPIFLEYLLHGMKSLYFYEAEGNIPVYFVEDHNQLVKIDAPRLSRQTATFQYKNQTDRYIPLLHYAFKDCPDLSSKIDRTRFNRKGLVELAKDYHYAMCISNEDCIEFEAKEEKRSVQLYVTPYVGVIQYMVPSGSSLELTQRPDLSYLAGATLAIGNKRWMSSLSGCLDLSFSRLASSTRILNVYDNTSYAIKYAGTMLSGKLGIRYTYPKGLIRPFAEFGVDISTLLASQIETGGESEEWMEDIFPGYYGNVGLNFKFSRSTKQMLYVRAQFKSLRDMIAKSNFVNAWSGVVGYTF